MRKIVVLIVVSCLGAFILYSIQNQVVASDSINTTQPIATVTFSNGEKVKIELYPEEAPNTVRNFIYLAEEGFYEGTFVNRVIPGYLVQAGDPIGNGYGFPGYYISTECRYNGVRNRLSHQRGTVSMARSKDYNTEGSQFFILLDDDRTLNGQYSAFGKIIEGLEVIDRMTTLEINEKYMPREPITIVDIEIALYDYEVTMPSVIAVGK